jgi:hypothetical protein
MLEENQESYFIDYHFLETHREVNTFNWLDYFQNHPDFDKSCLNLKYFSNRDISLDYLYNNKEYGIFYKFELKENSDLCSIQKYLIDEHDCFLLKIYFLFDNKILDSSNLKNTLLQKSANISALLNKAVNLAFEN